MTPEQARRDALIRLGGMEQTRQAWRERRTLPFLERLFHDARFTFRQLRKSPAFTLTAVLTLALGIGGMTAAFSVVEAVLLRPLPFQDPDRLISIHEHLARDSHALRVTAPDVLIFQRKNHAFSAQLDSLAQPTNSPALARHFVPALSGCRPLCFLCSALSPCWVAPSPNKRTRMLLRWPSSATPFGRNVSWVIPMCWARPSISTAVLTPA